ncbi:tRNA dihydrouridine synthase DusB [Galliscardovia ingluviei]|uniref:tRNA-dihydrouridine synthase n=1 Tax=Galliscardovia ingluviei TaxID=1769422 RepID=A0A8J3AFM2_9BIFI|nr:tRNA dihydrouridine synthase DusB [Galliscardovia ingluviei]GGI13004.1 tRNA dihydrouridine synthase DusB [Galliscardovia ingluviei]
MNKSTSERTASLLPAVRLGNIDVPTPVVLSPMAGVTNWPFRVLCEEQGPDGLYVAEMVTSRALVAGNPKALQLCEFAPTERVRSLQLYGVSPSIMEQATRMVVDGHMADHIDLNFGCPVPKITRRGGGSALPWKLDLLKDVLQAVVRVCEPAGIPVTAKFRVGIDDEHTTYLDAGKIAQDVGCAAVTLHARTTAQYYGGHSHWEHIARLAQALDIPVFGNGDIFSAQDAIDMVTQTGCAGVAIGRGCQGRPWIFADIKAAFAGEPLPPSPTLGQVAATIVRHGQLLVEFYHGNEQMAVRDLRKHVGWYLKGFPVGGSTRQALMSCESLVDVERVLSQFDPDIAYPEQIQDKPRGRTSFARKVHLPQGWLDSQHLTQEEREQVIGADPLDASY